MSEATARSTYHRTSHRGLSYQVRADGSKAFFGYAHGRRVLLTSTLERDAVAEYGEIRGKVAKGVKLAPAGIRLSEVAQDWIDQKNGRLREMTRRLYQASLDNEIIPALGSRKLREIGYDDVLKFVRKMEGRGLATSTVTSHLNVLNAIFKYALKRGLVAANPVALIDSSDRGAKVERDVDHVWSDEEITNLVSASEYLARQPESRYDYSPLIRVALATGLRQGELLGLQWQDIDLTEGVLHVRRQWSRSGEYTLPKTRAGARRIPLAADTVAVLKGLKEKAFGKGFSAPESPVFASKIGTPLTHRNVQARGFAAAAEHAEIEGVTFHSMRHAFASRMIAAGINPVTLAHLLGHTDASLTLNRYATLYDRAGTDEIVRQAMSR